MSASHRRAAESTRVSSTACRSKVERLMTLSTSAVAVCCCNDSQLIEQMCVLDSDDRLIGKILHQLDLLVGERTDFLTIDDDCADQLVFLEHGNGNQSSCTSRLDQSDNARITLEIRLIRGEVGNLQYFFAPADAGERIVRMFARDVRTSLHVFIITRRQAERCHRMKRTIVVTEQYTKFGLADAHGIPQHGLEYRLQFTRRRADDLQHLRGRSLLLQRLAEIVRALAQLVEQPSILDSDDGLAPKTGEQRDLLVIERLGLLAIDVDRAN